MEDFSEFLLGPQRSAGSSFSTVLALIAIALAAALMAYLLWCYFREDRIRKHIAYRAHRQCGGNIVPPAALPETKQLCRKRSRPLPPARDATRPVKQYRRGPHPWKQEHLRRESLTPP